MGFNSSQVGDDFNPRSHEGSDCKKKWYGAVLILISIHAPTKGATSENSSIIVSFHDFNPRSHEGSDLPLRRTYNKLFQFQSTLPRRERPKIIRKRCAWSQISIHAPTKGATRLPPSVIFYELDFNPRSHEGSDLHVSPPSKLSNNFNPRSHEGSDYK